MAELHTELDPLKGGKKEHVQEIIEEKNTSISGPTKSAFILSKEGFRVFLYDQAGSGLSDFLPHVRDYTFKRMVDDLEAVRKQIGTEKMIVIGHSWGSTLAAKYMATYPGRVSKVIFHAPGGIWDWKDTFDYSRTDSPGFSAIFPGVRFVAAMILADRNPDAAENLVSQRELEGLSIPVLDAEFGTVVCTGNSNRLPPEIAAMRAAHENPAMNPYVGRNIQFDNGDPHEALRKDPTPRATAQPCVNGRRCYSWSVSWRTSQATSQTEQIIVQKQTRIAIRQ